jgi:hypothetical protein
MNRKMKSETWMQGGAALSLGWLALALLRGRRGSARLAFAAAAAFLQKAAELRLHRRVFRLLDDPASWEMVP